MPVSQQFFLDAASLGSASSIFYDNTLTVCAPDGYYSDGIITRQQVGCVLLPEQICPDCGLPCNSMLNSDEAYQGVFRIDSNMGTATGAILLWFDPQNVPEGILVTFNSLTYNKLSSPTYGRLKSSNPYGYTYIGKTANDCGISGTTYPALTNFVYDGSTFVSQGTTQTVTVAPGDVEITALNPGRCLMVIPKPASTAAVLSVYIVGPCASTQYQLELECPQSLLPFMGTITADSSTTACEYPINNAYYFASVTEITTIAVHDYVFYDSWGAAPLVDGFYGIANATSQDWIEVVDGIIVALGPCSDCLSFRICNTSNTAAPNDCNGGGTGRAIKIQWIDCDNVSHSQSIMAGDCYCISTTLTNFFTNFSVVWASHCIPDPSGGNWTYTVNDPLCNL